MLDLKKMLTKISTMLKDEYVYQDYYCPATTLSSGSAATYATYQSVDITKSGYDAIGVSLLLVGHPAGYSVFPMIFNSSTEVRFLFYRTGTAAYNVVANDVKVRVLYKKSGGGYCLNGLKAVFSMLSAITGRWWQHVKHQEDTHQNPRAARFAGHVQAVHNKRFVQHNVVSEQNLRCIVERVQAYLHGLLNQLGELLCVLELFERKHRTSVCGEKRQHRDFDEFTNHLECHLHQGYALQVAPSGRGCF